MVGLFHGQIKTVPEIPLQGINTGGGRCELNYVFLANSLLLLVELKVFNPFNYRFVKCHRATVRGV
jgi:hypothetical protein